MMQTIPLNQTPGYVPGFRNVLNLRELGGHRAADGRTVKHGLIYRSGQLADATPEELARINLMGLGLVLDLRSAEEAEEAPDPAVPGASPERIAGCMDADDKEINLSPKNVYKLLFNPRRKDDDVEAGIISQIAEHYASMAFRNIAYQRLFDWLLEGRGPVLFHCTAGKDRTGIAAMLVLAALGVDDETVVADYTLTNRYRYELIAGKLADHPLLSKMSIGEFALLASEGVIERFGWRTLKEIKQEYGDYATFFESEYGLTSERIEALRDLYLE